MKQDIILRCMLGAFLGWVLHRYLNSANSTPDSAFPIQVTPEYPTGHPAHTAWLN